jgi:hypothetical protein
MERLLIKMRELGAERVSLRFLKLGLGDLNEASSH